MTRRKPYRSVVDAPKARARKHRRSPEAQSSRLRFLRFMLSSASCSLLDQLLAWCLFSLLRRHMAGSEFLRILISNVAARVVSLTLNYSLNHRLVFTLDVNDPDWQRSARRESLPRFIALSAFILALSTLGVYLAHRFLGIEEWRAKIVVDIALFFINYNVQRKWVFRHEVSVRPPAKRH